MSDMTDSLVGIEAQLAPDLVGLASAGFGDVHSEEQGDGSQRLADLDGRLLAAHNSDDRSSLVALYEEAGEIAEQSGKIDAACFYWTHSWVFALDTGSSRAETLRHHLIRHGRAE